MHRLSKSNIKTKLSTQLCVSIELKKHKWSIQIFIQSKHGKRNYRKEKDKYRFLIDIYQSHTSLYNFEFRNNYRLNSLGYVFLLNI
jgi:hypothetical protein